MSDRIFITGGNRLEGSLEIQGAKNAALPILAAALLCRGISHFEHIPNIDDVHITLQILKDLGCQVSFEEGRVSVDSTSPTGIDICDNLMRKLRSSVIFLGAVLSRIGEVHLSYPGGYIALCDFFTVSLPRVRVFEVLHLVFSLPVML